MPALLHEITSKNNSEFYCLYSFYLLRTKNKLKTHVNVYKNHNYCQAKISEKDINILEHNHGEKSLKAPFLFKLSLTSKNRRIS